MKNISKWYKIHKVLFFENDDDSNNNNNNNEIYYDESDDGGVTNTKSSSLLSSSQSKQSNKHQQFLNLTEIRSFEAISVFMRTLKHFIYCVVLQLSNCCRDNDGNRHSSVGTGGNDNNNNNNSSSSSIGNGGIGSRSSNNNNDDNNYSSNSNSFDERYLYELLDNRPILLDINSIIDIVKSFTVSYPSHDLLNESITNQYLSNIIEYITAAL